MIPGVTIAKCRQCHEGLVAHLNGLCRDCYRPITREYKRLYRRSNRRSHKYTRHRRKLYDAQKGRCGICHQPMAWDPQQVHVDHIVPIAVAKREGWAKNSWHQVWNLQATHAACNRWKYHHRTQLC